jgi:hypothetical protein
MAFAKNNFNPFVMAFGIILVVGGFVISLPANLRPAYRVRVVGGRNTIFVMKRNPDVDQKAICNAVKELEPEAHELAENERKMKKLAEGCRNEPNPVH